MHVGKDKRSQVGYAVALLVSAVIVVAACTQELPLRLALGEPLKLSYQEHDYAPATNCVIAPNSPQYQALEKWLSQNKSGWQTTPATYIPGKVVSGSGFTLNFLNSIVIANFSGGQYSHSTNPSEYRFLQCQ
jgi:hypothetical protein